MKNLFRKYFNSTLQPCEFKRVADFMGDEKNESILSKLMKPIWDNEMERSIEKPKKNPALFEKIRKSILQEKHNSVRKKISLYTIGLRIAAIVVLTLLISNIFFYKQADRNQLAEQIHTITTPYGAKSNITLPDGSMVWLNSGSTISFPAEFESKRPVHLVGEAFFDVVKSKKTFIVETEYGDVEVKGTCFNVKAFHADNLLETTLEEGSISFKDQNKEDGIDLQPGEQLIKTTQGISIKKVETKYYTSWKEGKLLFNREPFPDFIKKLERWYNVKIEYSDPGLNDLWYTGNIEMESISEVMEMISKAAPISYDYNRDTRIFTIEKINH